TATRTLDAGTKRNTFLVQLRSLLGECPCPDFAERYLVSFASVTIALELVLAPPTSPGFYPHSEGAALGPVQFGVRFQAQVHHHGDEPGLLGCCNLYNDLQGSAGFSQSPEQGGGCRCQYPSGKQI